MTIIGRNIQNKDPNTTFEVVNIILSELTVFLK